MGRAAVPSGASTGAHEAHELRDGDKSRYGGKGVQKAVSAVKDVIAKAIIGKDVFNQGQIDQALRELDGTKNKEKLGANAILAVSLATARAAAVSKEVPLYEYIGSLSEKKRKPLVPTPQCNIINGGAHTSWQSSDIQEFMIMPVGAVRFSEGIRAVAEIFQQLKKVLEAKGYGTTVGDEGGFPPEVRGGNEEALELIAEAIKKAGYKLGRDIVFALDVAASELYTGGMYELPIEKKKMSADDMAAWYGTLAKKYPIRSIEDGLGEEDWEGWKTLTKHMGKKTQLVGDDLLVTNVEFLARGIAEKAGNAILIKLNQIGTLTETIAAVDMAQRAGWRAIISHRSGETEDTTIAHLAVGLGTGQIKTGSVSRTDRTAKYNELLRIEESLGRKATYAGDVFKS